MTPSSQLKHKRVSNIDKRVRSLRRIGDDLENIGGNLEPDQPYALANSDDANNDKYADNENDEQQSALEDDNDNLEGKSKETKESNKDDDNENDEQQSALESDNENLKGKSKEIKESNNNKENLEDDDPGNQEIVTRFDVTDSSADKLLEISKLSAMTGFDYSPAEVEKFKIWPQGIIPFYIDEFSYDKILRDKIREYLDEANSMTGLRFLELPRPPANDDTRWVFIINRRGQLECADYNHKSFSNTGVQKLVIGYDCLGGAQHIASIVLALAGVPPQHNSPDRDRYIDVNMNSIQPDKAQLFTAVKPEDWLFHDIKYDFLSAGHYPCHKYTTDGSATIVPKSKINTFVGEVDGLSYTDVIKIRRLYNFVVEKDDKNAKLQDCKTLYRPGPKFKINPKSDQQSLSARKKPKEYIEAAQRAGIEIVVGSESTPGSQKNQNTDKENNNDDENTNNPNDENNESQTLLGKNNDHSISQNDVKNNDVNGSENGPEAARMSSNEVLKDPKSTTAFNPMTMIDKIEKPSNEKE